MKHRKHAFTLVELLVVDRHHRSPGRLIVAGNSIGARSARRSQCKNNLRQIGLAIHNHVSSLRVFPTGGAGSFPKIQNYVVSGKPFGTDKQGLGWAYQILPYLEEGAIVGLVTQDQLQAAVIPLYVCPSRRSGSGMFAGKPVSLIDYAASQPCTAQCPAGSPDCPDPTPLYNPLDSSPITAAGYELNLPSIWGGINENSTQQDHYQVYDGVIVRSPWRRNDPLITHGAAGGEFLNGVPRPTTIAKITDGTSKTFMIGEKYVRSDLYSGGGPSDDHGWSEGWDTDADSLDLFPTLSGRRWLSVSIVGDGRHFWARPRSCLLRVSPPRRIQCPLCRRVDPYAELRHRRSPLQCPGRREPAKKLSTTRP